MDKVKVPYVLAVGAVGGALSWLFAVTLGLPPALPLWWQAIPAAVVLGAAAAFLGVYLLAGTDLSQVNRCLAFALLCGFSWKPVFDAGSALVEQSLQQREVRHEAVRLQTRSAQLLDDLNGAPPETVSAVVGEAGEVARGLADMARKTEEADPEFAAGLRLRAAETVIAAAKVTPQHPSARALPVEELRRELEDGQRHWAQRDPQQAERFARAQAELKRAAGRN